MKQRLGRVQFVLIQYAPWIGGILMEDGLLRAVDNTVRFLRLAAIELRRLAGRAPDISGELQHVADQLEADAAELGHAAGSSRNRP